jgi:molybdopterin-guanine dinucleotide biosynthesis protein
MLFGITGAAGTGKTTLAKRVAEDLGITYLSGSITEIAKRHGFDSVAPMSLQDRIRLQFKLLEDHVSMVAKAERPLIVDRTPIDLVGYMLAEIDMHSHMRLTSEEIVAIEEYVDLCLETTAKLYDYIFILGQLDHYEVKESRPADNRAYQTHTQLIMQGCMSRIYGRVNFTIIRQQDLEARHELVFDTVVKRMDDISRERSSSAHIH